MQLKFSLILLLGGIVCASCAQLRSSSELADETPLPEIQVKLKSSGDRLITLSYFNSGSVGMIYRVKDDAKADLVKFPFSNQTGLFQAEINLFNEKRVREGLGDSLIASSTDEITEMNGKAVQIPTLRKPEIMGRPVMSSDVKGNDELFRDLFNKLKTLATQHHLLIDDLHVDNVLLSNEGPKKIRIIDGLMRSVTTTEEARVQFLEACETWPWCSKYAREIVATGPLAKSCSRLMDLFR